jgi:hypothetical protein
MVKACEEESASGNTKDVAGELREAEGAQTAGGAVAWRSARRTRPRAQEIWPAAHPALRARSKSI